MSNNDEQIAEALGALNDCVIHLSKRLEEVEKYATDLSTFTGRLLMRVEELEAKSTEYNKQFGVL
tara:strand:+ start:592 stop:786 length:195 start_codon:yes stop_codon:yes gene_type:complete